MILLTRKRKLCAHKACQPTSVATKAVRVGMTYCVCHSEPHEGSAVNRGILLKGEQEFETCDSPKIELAPMYFSTSGASFYF